MGEQLVNLTPHPVHVLAEDGAVVLTLESVGTARVEMVEVDAEAVCGVPTVRLEPTAVVGLPAVRDGVWLVVSRTTADSAVRAGRDGRDLLVPTRMVRDAEGLVVGCRALSRVQVDGGTQ